MLNKVEQIASIFTAVLVPAALLMSARQTRLLRQQVEAETTARHMQIYQALHENMAQRASLFLEYPAYRPLFCQNQDLSPDLDPHLAATIAEMTVDVLDTAAVQASVLPKELAAPLMGICFTMYGDSRYVREYWAEFHQEYSEPLRRLLPVPSVGGPDT